MKVSIRGMQKKAAPIRRHHGLHVVLLVRERFKEQKTRVASKNQTPQKRHAMTSERNSTWAPSISKKARVY